MAALAPSPLRPCATKKETTPLKFAAHSKNAGKVTCSGRAAAQRSHPLTNVHIAGWEADTALAIATSQMDRFIPNRSSSNLDIASYVSRECLDVENLDALSPSKVC